MSDSQSGAGAGPGQSTASARTSARLDPLGALRRTHACGALRADAIGREVVVARLGAPRARPRRRARSSTCATATASRRSCSARQVAPEVHERARASCGSECVVAVRGMVERAPAGDGEREAARPARSRCTATELRILNRRDDAAVPDRATTSGADEELRLSYRYLDLRRPPLQRALRAAPPRASGGARYLVEPAASSRSRRRSSSKPTPEGARDYLVPSRLQPRQVLRAAAVAADLSSSCSWSRASTATSRSRAASATRTCAPIASPSSRRSTSRCASSSEEDVFAVIEGLTGRARGATRSATDAAAPVPAPHLRRGDAPLRHRQAGHARALELVELTDLFRRQRFQGLRRAPSPRAAS